jgi:predicted DNA-binding WGR domain protein
MNTDRAREWFKNNNDQEAIAVSHDWLLLSLKNNGFVDPRDYRISVPVTPTEAVRVRMARIPRNVHSGHGDATWQMTEWEGDPAVYCENKIRWKACLALQNSKKNQSKYYILWISEGGHRLSIAYGRIGRSPQCRRCDYDIVADTKKVFAEKYREKSGHEWMKDTRSQLTGKYSTYEGPLENGIPWVASKAGDRSETKEARKPQTRYDGRGAADYIGKMH